MLAVAAEEEEWMEKQSKTGLQNCPMGSDGLGDMNSGRPGRFTIWPSTATKVQPMAPTGSS